MHLISTHLEACLNVRTSAGLGTCFFRRVASKGAFLSAAHVFEGVQSGETVYFRAAEGWRPFSIAEIIVHPDGDDVCAFTLNDLAWKTDESETRYPSLLPGDPVRFLGFPHGLENTYPSEIGFATPLVRHAHLSGAIVVKGRIIQVLDGFNNPGYSGGPIYAALGDQIPTLLGVVSGYRIELREKSLVYRDEGGGSARSLPDLFVKPNSGMIEAVTLASVRKVFDLISSSNAALD